MRRWLPLRFVPVLFVFIVVATLVSFAPLKASSNAVLHGFPSAAPVGPVSLVRDVTKVGSRIYAVGASKNPGTGALDAVLWTLDPLGTPLETAMPNLVVGGAQTTAEQITTDASFIATQARATGGPVATRVSTNGFGLTNLNVSPYTVFIQPNAARTVSDDGRILYGDVNALVPVTLVGPPPTIANRQRARIARYDTLTSTSALINPIAPALDTSATPLVQTMLPRGASADGSVAVGWQFHTQGIAGQPPLPRDDQAFRYVNTNGTGSVTSLARLDGGTWNRPLAISPNGALVTLIGDSTHYANGEIYLLNTGNSAITELGSPNTAWGMPLTTAGMTSTGSVVALAFADTTQPLGSSGAGFVRNSHGWFHLRTVLTAAGVDLTGWDRFFVFGMSSDATLMWGWGRHNGNQEGFVIEFASNYLEEFDVVASSPADQSIVGAWALSQSGSTSNPDGVLAFLPDGTYFQIEPEGFERGLYTFDGSVVTFVTKVDTNGDSGVSDENGQSGVTIAVTGDTLTLVNDPTCPECAGQSLHRITGAITDPIGGWFVGDPVHDDSSAVVVFTSSGKYFMAQDGDSRPGTGDPSGQDGIEIGTYSVGAGGVVTATQTIDTNGQWGLSHSTGALIITISSDGLALTAADDSGPTVATRIIAPASVTPEITSALTASATVTVPFSYTVTATHGAFTFDATSLPAGLTIDTSTGVISGTPASAGSFDVPLSAANTLATGHATLQIMVASPNTSSGQNVAIDPEVPAGSATVGLTFGAVTGAGETSVTVIDPATDPGAQPPPSGFTLGDSPIYYEIETTASFTGPVEVCFNYTGVDLGAGTPRLFHFTNEAWVDITTRIDEVNHIICGMTTSFSPFAVFVSPITRSGFYSPVTSTPGFVNVIKSGSTVPLKFSVEVNGAAKTDTAGLAFSVSAVSCTNPGAGTPVAFQTAGGTSLRYDETAGLFIQNWKAPTGLGCYMVRMTTTDGLSLSALFRVK